MPDEKRPPRPPLPWIAAVLAVVYLVRLLTPPGPLRRLTGIWSPLLVAVVFTLLERRPWREALNLGPGWVMRARPRRTS